MNIPILSSLFGKNNSSLQPLDSILISKLKIFAKEKNYPLFENTPVFHRSQKVDVPLLLFIPKTGLVLFEYKEWSYEELRDAHVSKTSHAQKSENSLSFESIGDFIKEKFIDLTSFDDIDIFNFVIMEQLREDEFNMLDTSFHELLPKERILFHDSSEEQIERKFKALQTKQKTYTVQNTLPFIFSQYMILDEKKIYFANKDQRDFIDKNLENIENLVADRQSGKSSVLVQKALLEKLQQPQKKIAILAPTHLQAELLKHTLLELVELSSVVLDMNDISIYTPNDILNEHRRRLKKAPTAEILIEAFHLHKGLDIADTLLVDDAFLMNTEFIAYLKHIQKGKTLLLINSLEDETTASLSQNYYGEIELLQTPEYPTLLKKINTIVKAKKDVDILIFTADEDFEAIKEDIEGFTAQELSLIETDHSLREQSPTPIKLCNYDPKVPLHATYTFLIQSCQSDYSALKYLAKSSREKSFIIYEDECDNISRLKNLLKDTHEQDTQK